MRFRISGRNWEGRNWVLAPCLVTLATQIDTLHPDRHPADGTVASKTHDQNNPNSDHRPRPFSGPGIVRALDAGETTEDDAFKIAEAIRRARDPRVKYLIHERRLFSSYVSGGIAPYTWRPYSLTPHDHHLHVSTLSTHDNDTRPWAMGLTKEDLMRLPPERRADLAAMLAKGWVGGDLTYYFPVEGQPSADLPPDVWVNLVLAGIGGAAREPGGGGYTPAQIRKIVSDAIANG